MTKLAGCDSAGHPTGAALKAAGIQVVGCYLTGAYAISRAIVEDYSSHGLWLWSIFEVRSHAASRGANGGAVDARAALAAAKDIGQPAGSSITFCDDTDEIAQATVLDYWRGAAAIRPGHLVGGYGPHALCTAALEAGVIDLAMVAGAWDNGAPYTGIAIHQLTTQRTIGGVAVDLDDVLEPHRAGLWNAHGLYPAAPKPKPKPDPKPEEDDVQIHDVAVTVKAGRRQGSVTVDANPAKVISALYTAGGGAPAIQQPRTAGAGGKTVVIVTLPSVLHKTATFAIRITEAS